MHGAAEEAAQSGSPDALPAHVLGVCHKVFFHALFNHEAFDGAGAGDPFVEVAGDAGVDLADLSVHEREPALKETEKQHGDRENRNHRKRQTCIGDQHHEDRTDEIAALPDRVQKRPGTEFSDARGIAHDPGMDVTDAVLVVVGEGQRLQMGEGGIAQVHVHADFDLHAIDAADVVEQSADQNHGQVEKQIERKALQGAEGDKMVQRIALKERNADVHNAAEGAGKQHQHQGGAIASELRKQTAKAEEPVRILFHPAASPLPDCMAQIRWYSPPAFFSSS